MMNKFRTIIAITILLSNGCQNDKPNAAAPPSSNPPTESAASFPSPPSIAPPTFPQVWFRAKLEHVVVRDTPSTTSKEQYALSAISLFTGKTTAFKESILLRGKKVPMPWYQTHNYINSDMTISDSYVKGWVYGGCVTPFLFDLTGIGDSVQHESTKQWLILEEIDSIYFKQNALKKRLIHSDKDSVGTPNKIRMNILGKDSILIGIKGVGEGDCIFETFKELPDWYYYSASYWEWADCCFVRKSDGEFIKSFGTPWDNVPLLSPRNTLCTFKSHQGYSDLYNKGFEIFDFKTGTFTGFQIHYNMDIKDLAWKSDREILIFVHNYNTAKYFKITFTGLFQ